MSQGQPTPTYILRGHLAPVHTLLFFQSNLLLASGDSDGWLVIWRLASKRPIAVWKAHDGGVSGCKVWGSDRVITHGRDHKLRVWEISLNESTLSTQLPVDGATEDQPKPWLLHSLDMSALNFCAFATCSDPWADTKTENNDNELLIASPNGLDSGGIDIFQLPTQHRMSQIPSDKSNNTGMVMAIALLYSKQTNYLKVVSGYEDGQVMVHSNQQPVGTNNCKWEMLISCKVHSQPVLSLALSPDENYFMTSSADSIIAKFEIPHSTPVVNATATKTINTKHAGQQGLSVRSDGKIFATAGWDARVRVYSMKTLKELAVLKWHKDGCYSTAFAGIEDGSSQKMNAQSTEIAKMSALEMIKHERTLKAQQMHWLAAGGKDGKVSLWDIY